MILKKELYLFANIIIIAICFFWFKDYTYRFSLGFMLLFIFLITGDFKIKIKKIYDDKIAFSFFLMFALYLIGLIWTEDFSSVHLFLIKASSFLFAPLIITMYDKKYLKLMLFVLSLSLFYMAVNSIITYYDEVGIYQFYEKISPYGLSTFYGPILTFIAVYFLSKVNIEKTFYSKENVIFQSIFYFYVYVLILVCNRSSILTIFLVLIVFYIFMNKSVAISKKIKYLSINFIVIVSLMYNINDNCKKRIDNTVSVIFSLDLKSQVSNLDSLKRSSLSCRFEFWAHSFNIIKKNKLLGVGTGDGYKEIRELLGEKEHKKMFDDCTLTSSYHFNPHNMYILLLLLFGPLGLLVLFYMLYVQFQNAIKYNSKVLFISIFSLMFIMLSSSILFTSMFFITFYSIFIPIVYLIAKESVDDKSFLKWK